MQSKFVSKGKSPISKVVIFEITAVLTLVVCCVCSSLMVYKGILTEDAVCISAQISIGISAFIAGILTMSREGKWRWEICYISGAVYYILLLCASAFLANSGLERLTSNGIALLIGCSVAVISTKITPIISKKKRYRFTSR